MHSHYLLIDPVLNNNAHDYPMHIQNLGNSNISNFLIIPMTFILPTILIIQTILIFWMIVIFVTIPMIPIFFYDFYISDNSGESNISEIVRKFELLDVP